MFSIQKQLRSILLGTILFLTIPSHSQNVRCNLSHIAGFDAQYTIGQAICGTSTDLMEETKLYLSPRGNDLYIHSNYKPPEADFPTKIATGDPIASIEDIAMNIIFDKYPSESELDELRADLRESIEVVVDPSLFSHPKFSSLDLTSARILKIACPDDNVREAVRIRNGSTIEYGVRYNNQFSVRIKGQNLDFVFSALRQQKIDFETISVLNLVENKATKRVLEEKFAGQTISFDYSSVENFKQALLANRGKRTIVLGHIEDGQFVTLDNGGHEIFRISIADIERFQKENNLELLLLGCNSAEEGASTGALNKFNSVDALNRLETTRRTQNVEEFLDSLSMGTVHLLIDETFFPASGSLSTETGLPERIDVLVFDQPQGGASHTLDADEVKGKLIVLGLGTAAAIALQQQRDSAASQQLATVTDPQDQKEGSGKRDQTTFIVIGVLVLIVGGVIYFIAKK